jgi:hypothetical protein
MRNRLRSRVERNRVAPTQAKPKLVRFHCGYSGKDGHKDEFCFKRKHEERMAKEWANKNGYNASHGVPKPRMPLLKRTEISANGNPTLCTSVIVPGRGYHVQSLSQVVQIHTTRE